MFRKTFHFLFRKHRLKTIVGLVVLLVCYWWSLPSPLFDTPHSMVLEDREGYLLGARIAADGQWRFAAKGDVPEKFAKAITTFEDRRFYSHFGIDPVGIGRAIRQNLKNKRIVSGGSTLSMQVMRMARRQKSRSVFQKIIEAILATRLEWSYSKAEILSLYAANAPFGGNVVGLDAASWRYYGKQPTQLSWAEAATLAVLPNSPSLIHPGRNRSALKAKRNRLLNRMLAEGHFDEQALELALLEPLPDKPLPLPDIAPHLLETLRNNNNRGNGQNTYRITTTIDRDLQRRTNTILQYHHELLSGNGIHNLAALIIDVEANQLLAYVGNAPGATEQPDVNVIPAPRSTGSILKPFLYAFALENGTIGPESYLPDIPTFLSGYRPKNYHDSYDGLVTARRALARSLNVPMVRLLQDYGLEKFRYDLGELHLQTIDQPASHYGLTLILGGAESTLWEVSNAYAGMARAVNHFQTQNGQYRTDEFDWAEWDLSDALKKKSKAGLQNEPPVLSAASCWQTFEAMRTVERPTASGEWERFGSGQEIAWKTGTSFGFRDAWAVGVTPRYVVGVWAGNADGEGRPGLVGVKAAGPVMFDVFRLLKSAEWFQQPMDEMREAEICAVTGFRALADCPKKMEWLGPGREKLMPCRFHQKVFLTSDEAYQVNRDCANGGDVVVRNHLVISPLEEQYYRHHQPTYQPLPPLHPDCKKRQINTGETIEIIYPQQGANIYVPVELDGSLGKTVFKAACRHPEGKLYWHLNNEYLGMTDNFHEMALQPEAGEYVLTIVDENGGKVVRTFSIVNKK